MASINFKKKLDKLNQFMKIPDREVYFWSYSSGTLQNVLFYSDIREDIQKIIRDHFHENCEVYYLGSRVIGIADTDESDLDFFIDIGKVSYFRNRNYDHDMKTIGKLTNILKNMPQEWEVKRINYSIPSIKAIHKASMIKCDISATNGMSVNNSHILAHLFEIQPEASAFYHYIKRWLRLFNVTFKGFTLTLMVIFYLQSLNLMPSIERVQDSVPPEFIDKFAVQYDDTRDRDFYGIEEMKSFRLYLRGFFNFYANFSYEDCVICPHSGKVVFKEKFSYRIDDSKPITIAAPLLRRHNCAKYLSNIDLVNFVTACQFSVKYMDEYKAPKSSGTYHFFS